MNKSILVSVALRIIKGYLFAVMLTLAGIMLDALLLWKTSFGMKSSFPLMLSFLSLSVIVAGYTTASSIGKRGLFFGMLGSLVFVSLFLIFYALIFELNGVSSGKMALLSLPVLLGTAAGVIGVGKK